jgi:hypothetical protein
VVLGLDMRFLGQKRQKQFWRWEIGVFAAAKMAHLIDDKTVAKMGHPVVVVWSDVGHPSEARNDIS